MQPISESFYKKSTTLELTTKLTTMKNNKTQFTKKHQKNKPRREFTA